jgi:hypothetical protein
LYRFSRKTAQSRDRSRKNVGENRQFPWEFLFGRWHSHFKHLLEANPSSSGVDDIRDYYYHVVHIEPLESILIVQDFLWME